MIGALTGMQTVTGMFNSLPWYASARPWLPADAVMTPKRSKIQSFFIRTHFIRKKNRAGNVKVLRDSMARNPNDLRLGLKKPTKFEDC